MSLPHPRGAAVLALLILTQAGTLPAQRPGPMVPGVLRVCADPANLPFSDSTGAGVENKLAEMLAADWHSQLQYVWWAAPRGLARMLNGRYCDVVMQAPAGYDLAGVTRPYYRTSYVIVQRRGAPHLVTGLDDPALRTMKIGVHLYANDAENSPPAMALSRHGVVGNLVGFSTVYMSGRDHPSDIIKAVVDGTVDLAMVWGPIAGHYAKSLSADLILTPILEDTLSGIPFAFSMGLATRNRERELKDSLEKFLETRGPDIRRLLEQYGIPLLPLPADSAVRPAMADPGR